MIPSTIDERSPPGECDIYTMLAAGPEDWLILHSLDLAPWNHNKRTEIDFVVVVPDTGILCVEVKSHRNITFDGQRWLPGEIRRSPFKQAMDGRYAFYRRLRDFLPSLKHVPVVHCCLFPRTRFDVQPNMSVAEWEVMDLRAFEKLHAPKLFCSDLKSRLMRGIGADPHLRPLDTPLTREDVTRLIQACVPVQKTVPGIREEIERREAQLTGILREQQKPVLHLAEYNSHLVVSGAAGTGKTMIAIALARQMAFKGLRVALLCYNQLVGNWLRRMMAEHSPAHPNLVIGRAIRVMAEMTGVGIPSAPAQEYWEGELPALLGERLRDPDLLAASAFDYLVLDEAQDLLARPPLWQCLVQLLRDRDKVSSFALFGDFEHQVLGDQERLCATLADVREKFTPARWHLSENCRNYRIVAKTALGLSGLPPSVYTGYLRTGGGQDNCDIAFYDDREEQAKLLNQWLTEFRSMGFQPREISVLSFCGEEKCIAKELRHSVHELRPAWCSGTHTAYASIHAFKGMENKVIILTDVALADRDFHRDLFYTGMTRATEHLRILCDRKLIHTLDEWLGRKE